MKITKTYSWNRRDFWYDDECEFCGHTSTNNSGYDDDYYYNTVVPGQKCKSCGKSTKEHGSHEQTTPRHDPNIIM